jgi:predicted glycosyltransferase
VKFWIDVTSLPHVHFFRALVKRLEKSGNEVLVTSREFGIMNDILEKSGIEYKSVGSHGGRGLEGKLVKSCQRVIELTRLLSKEKPDVGLSKHSVESSRVCFGLGIPSINVIDHETAEAAMRLMVPLCDLVISPEATPLRSLKRFGLREISQFQGVCETAHFNDFRPSKDVLEKLGFSRNERIIIARSEPLLSAHNFHHSTLFSVIGEIKDDFPDSRIVFIPRDNDDSERFRKLGLTVPGESIDTLSLYSFASLMIGAGSCMNREAAIGGCPTISICPDNLPAVDRFLIEKGLMHHSLDKDEIVRKSAEILASRTQTHRDVNGKVLKDFEDPHEKIMEAIKHLAKPNNP